MAYFDYREVVQSGRGVVLAGAGVSKPPPSGLPTGMDFTTEFYRFLESRDPDPGFSSQIERLKGHLALRFERIMSLIERNTMMGPGPILDCYRDCEVINELHLLLARMGMEGHTIVTTNFDSLIERAFLAYGVVPNSVIDDGEFEKGGRGIGTVFKLHGSLQRFEAATGQWVSCHRSLRATIQQIGRQGYAFASSLAKRRFLVEALGSKDLMVVGYSGYDDFDVCPTLLAVKSEKRLLWFDYHRGETEFYPGGKIVENADRLSKGGRLLAELILLGRRPAESCLLIRCDPSRTIPPLVSPGPGNISARPDPNHVDQIDPRVYFPGRFAKVFDADHSVVGMKAALYCQIKEFNRALELYKKVLPGAEASTDAVYRSKLFHEAALCFHCVDPPDNISAKKYAEKALSIDREHGLDGIILGEDLVARISAFEGDTAYAERMWGSACAVNDRKTDYFSLYQRATALNNFSSFLCGLGRFREAFQAADKAVSCFRICGDLDGIVTATICSAAPLIELGRVRTAIDCLKEVEKIAVELNSLSDLCALRNEMGIAAGRIGEFSESIEHHRRSIEHARAIGDTCEVARNLYNIAACNLSLGRLADAREANESSETIRRKMGDSRSRMMGLSENLQMAGHIYLKQADFHNAKKAYSASAELAGQCGYGATAADSLANLLAVGMMLRQDEVVLDSLERLKSLPITRESARWTPAIQHGAQYLAAAGSKLANGS